jgi:hypothetical protein
MRHSFNVVLSYKTKTIRPTCFWFSKEYLHEKTFEKDVNGESKDHANRIVRAQLYEESLPCTPIDVNVVSCYKYPV